MWPRFRKRGNRPSSVAATVSLLLQCGRAFESAEMMGGSGRIPGRGPASMWPRFRKRGNDGRKWPHSRTRPGFNVAALSKARKSLLDLDPNQRQSASMWPRFRKRGNSPGSRLVARRIMCFNVAALSKARKLSGLTWTLAGRGSFNVAALSKARKWCEHAGAGQKRDASMWPRFRKRGNSEIREKDLPAIRASMWPRFRKRGNTPTDGRSRSRSSLQCGRAFESAEIGRFIWINACPMTLQCGRAFESAEIPTRGRRRGRPSRFNVAALSKARKSGADLNLLALRAHASMWPRFRKRGNRRKPPSDGKMASLQCGRAFESAEIREPRRP